MRRGVKKQQQQQRLDLDTPTRAAVYLRVSTDDQARGYGLDAQRSKCSAMATVKGWEIVKEYCDEGISGAKGAAERPALRALLDDARAGRIDAVIFAALDRLGRKTQLVLELVDALTAAGVTLVSCKESLDTGTASGRFVLTMFASLAELERATILERTHGGREERGQRDGERGGRVPLGYRRVWVGTPPVSVIEVDAEAAEIVRDIFTRRAGGASLRKIAGALNAAGVPCSQNGATWEAATVKAILDNREIYQGGVRGGDSRATWPVILGGAE